MFDGLSPWFGKLKAQGVAVLSLERSPVAKRARWTTVDTWNFPKANNKAQITRLIQAIQATSEGESLTVAEPTIFALKALDGEGLVIHETSERIEPAESVGKESDAEFWRAAFLRAQEDTHRANAQLLESAKHAGQLANMMAANAVDATSSLNAFMTTVAELQLTAGGGSGDLGPLMEAVGGIVEAVKMKKAMSPDQGAA